MDLIKDMDNWTDELSLPNQQWDQYSKALHGVSIRWTPRVWENIHLEKLYQPGFGYDCKYSLIV